MLILIKIKLFEKSPQIHPWFIGYQNASKYGLSTIYRVSKKKFRHLGGGAVE